MQYYFFHNGLINSLLFFLLVEIFNGIYSVCALLAMNVVGSLGLTGHCRRQSNL